MKEYTITVNGVSYDVTVDEKGSGSVQNAAPVQKESPVQKKEEVKAATASKGSIPVTAPMPGKILAIKVKEGDHVHSGDVLLVLEAMKMENDIVAPKDGTVVGIHTKVGDSVESAQLLIGLDE